MIQEMISALHYDQDAINSRSGPALARVKMIQDLETLLKKKPVQMEFLEQSGLEVLAHWISANPDYSYPLP